ncbi:HAD family hydrolase [Aquibacillus sediminis]|uniref:HAD family hydrolase n=1 Tax=Aquibacillus sediminis TaxID=2574734 RepID=UPI001108FA87|nr:HAD family hydrolase [Aquibacillus sediminis]
MIKLFATDLDGTLLKHGDNETIYILDEDKQAIQTVKDHGVEFGIATGRSEKDIVEILKTINQTGHRISQNGAFVYDIGDRLIHEEIFSKQLSKEIYEKVAQETDYHFVTTADEIHVTAKSHATERLERLSYFKVTETPNLRDTFGETVFASKFSMHGETEDLLQIKQRLDQQFNDNIESYLSDRHCVDIQPKGVSKALGLKYLMETLQLKPEEIAVIGDSYNDVSMFELTPHSYAIDTADPEVQQQANKVVKHVHNAVADLKERGLI